jgi:hypothetical protein
MKKIVALVLALSLMATMVFAEPVVLASEIIQTTDLISEADLSDPLFADIVASALNEQEAEKIEGGLLGGAILYGGVAIVGVFTGAYPSYVPSSQSRNNAVASALYYGGIVVGMMGVGAVVGACSPF